MIQACPCGCSAQWSHVLEQALHGGRGGDVAIAAIWSVGISMVEEIHVDAVRIMGRADWRDRGKSVGGFSPGSAGHGAAVVDQEDGVEGAEEGVGRVVVDLHCVGEVGGREGCAIGYTGEMVVV